MNPRRLWLLPLLPALLLFSILSSNPELAGSPGKWLMPNTPPPPAWRSISTAGAPSGRSGHTLVWTGQRLVVWGGYAPPEEYLNDGGVYNPWDNTWSPVSPAQAPSGRLHHTAVWTGTEMIVWGGQTDPDGSSTDTGAIYNPATDSWKSMSRSNAPSARQMHTAVWTGKKMIVWGGCATIECETVYNDGGSYDPSTDTWKPVSGAAGMPGRHSHQAVWTGTKMILWGGTSEVRGAAFEPKTGTWTAISAVEAPVPTFRGASVWTGRNMIVWGGCTEYTTGLCASYVNSGGRYDPVLDEWSPVTQQGAPAARWSHTMILFGGGVFVWGGCGDACYSNGGIYIDNSDTWLPEYYHWGGPSPRSQHAAASIGDAMAVWGGCDRNLCDDQANYFNGGGIFDLYPPDPYPSPTYPTLPTSTSTPIPCTYCGYLPQILQWKYQTPTPSPTVTPTPT